MTYRVYIKKDYKPEVAWVENSSKSRHLFRLAGLAFLLIVSSWFILGVNSPSANQQQTNVDVEPLIPAVINELNTISANPTPSFDSENITTRYLDENNSVEFGQDINTEFTQIPEIENEDTLDTNEFGIAQESKPPSPDIDWQKVTVKSGDSLALIFSRLSLSPNTLYRLLSLGKDVSQLKKLRPGQKINFHIADSELLGLEYEMDLTNTLKISKKENAYQSEIIHEQLETIVKNANATITDSLFLSGKRAGLSDNLIMQLVSIYGWDIDFALDIRQGDSFTVIYEEQYKDGAKVSDGPIIAAEFINQNNALRTIRYTHADGSYDYYADNGDAMRKAFLRTPVNFTRISSGFNLKRKHPILNRIRAHKGVDYAAPLGTPIKATGDGVVAFAGKKGGYGNTIILKHGGTYTTVYGHLYKYAKGVRTGKRVKQGQIIAYVGKSGLATGPHLHYEFRVNGVHRNPLTVKLPKVESINKDELPEFQKKITPMLAELDRITGKNVLAAKQSNVSKNKANSNMEDG